MSRSTRSCKFRSPKLIPEECIATEEKNGRLGGKYSLEEDAGKKVIKGLFHCSGCGKTFFSRSGRARHVKKNHGAALSPKRTTVPSKKENKRNLGQKDGPTCTDCGETLRSQVQLVEHINQDHDGSFRIIERNFETSEAAEAWLAEMCEATGSRFFKTHVSSEGSFRVVYNKCIRVERYMSRKKRNRRKSSMNSFDSCTAFSMIKTYKPGFVHVRACFDHSSHEPDKIEQVDKVGHEIGIPPLDGVTQDVLGLKLENEENREKPIKQEIEDYEEEVEMERYREEWVKEETEDYEERQEEYQEKLIKDEVMEENEMEELTKIEEPETMELPEEPSGSMRAERRIVDSDHDYCSFQGSSKPMPIIDPLWQMPKVDQSFVLDRRNRVVNGYGNLRITHIDLQNQKLRRLHGLCPVEGCARSCPVFRVHRNPMGILVIRRCPRSHRTVWRSYK
ncbi:unnamed protein product [Caenorhabditis auriculariae]|uniref:C2H2-type domain-containing protein n=1 Tax=Caenorhabditis auriculariae TaxID=2777116 RepID=A0A8S1HNQ0_9PELO|nr:unnamed protein product [Caenorhabditis auriculariae]